MKDYLYLPKASLNNGELVFNSNDGFEKSMEIGAFYLKFPEDIYHSPMIQLCKNFYKETLDKSDRYKGHKIKTHSKSKLGYEDRPNQVEQLQIESHLWDEYFPKEVADNLHKMKLATGTALLKLLEYAGVHERDLEVIAGKSINIENFETSLCYTTVNNYRSRVRNKIGIVEHTDSGFITTIYTDEEGYEVFYQEEWRSVPHLDNYYVVNLGDAFGILTKNLPIPGTAVLHRVPELAKDISRCSFTIYMGPDFDMKLYEYSKPNTLKVFDSFKSFSISKAERMGYEFHKRV